MNSFSKNIKFVQILQQPFYIKKLDAIERVSHLKPLPCLALEDEFESFIEKLAQTNVRSRDRAPTESFF